MESLVCPISLMLNQRVSSGKSILGSVNYDGNDRFTLNGQRLMRISPSGIEYRYEIEQWSKVLADGDVANPRSWTEHLPNGNVRRYGSTTVITFP